MANEASNKPNIEVVTVTLTEMQQRAMRKIALRGKKTGSQQITEWAGQKIKTAFKTLFKSEDVKKELEAQYKRYEQMQVQFNQPVAITLEEYIKRNMVEVDEIYANL